MFQNYTFTSSAMIKLLQCTVRPKNTSSHRGHWFSLLRNPIQNPDIYKDLVHLQEHLDFSRYPKEHFLFRNDNKKIPSKLPDELKRNLLTKTVFLKRKAYSIEFIDNSVLELKRSTRDVNKNVAALFVIKKNSVLFDKSSIRKTIITIASKNHLIKSH